MSQCDATFNLKIKIGHSVTIDFALHLDCFMDESHSLDNECDTMTTK